MKRKILIATLFLIGILMILPMNAMAAEIIDSGECGPNLTWTLDSEGLLTISGEGKMDDYEFGDTPWFSNNINIKKIVISEGTKSIGDKAFERCENLQQIEIPNSVVNIGNASFWGCKLLKNIIIPDSVIVIENSAFHSCYSLEEIKLSANLTTIEYYCFSECSSLKNIHIPSKVSFIDGYIFDKCTELEKITVADNNEHYSCDEQGALYNKEKSILIACPKTKITFNIPGSVNTIIYGSFSHCKLLTEVTLPKTIRTINGSSFDGCSSLQTIYYGGSESDWNNIYLLSSGNTDLLLADIHYNHQCDVHTLQSMVVSPATCTQRALLKDICTVCTYESETYEDSDEPSGHSWGNWYIVVNPLCTSKGSETRNCSACHASESRDVPALEHLYDNEEDTNCNYCGQFRLIGCVNHALGITLTTTYDAQYTLSGEESDKVTMIYTGQSSIIIGSYAKYQKNYQLTFKESGKYELTLIQDVTGSITKFNAVIKDHVAVTTPSVSQTCTQTGLTEGKHCSVCGEVLIPQSVIPANGHSETIIEGTSPTCTQAGLTEGKYCPVCNETIIAQQEIPATGHTETTINTQEPTETTDGYSGDTVCAVCGEILEAGEIIPALGVPYELGDVNGDDKINALDATQILRFANNKPSALSALDKSEQFGRSDINGDGKINALDATQILRYANNKPSALTK